MTQLDLATKRLEQAVERLEQVLAAGVKPNGDNVVELQAQLEHSERENASLRGVTSDVSDRLDHAIVRLRTILEA